MTNLIIDPGSHRSRIEDLLATSHGIVRIASPYVTGKVVLPVSRRTFAF